MITLALDTATAVSSAALVDGRAVLAERSHTAPTGHAESLAGLVRGVLYGADPAGIDRIVVGVGPGPFTGLRVAVVTGLMLAQVWPVELVGICSLDGLGAGVEDGVVVTDARRREVFAARYRDGRRVEGPLVMPRDEVSRTWPGAALTGPAVDLCGGGAPCEVSAAGLALVADTAPRLPVRPWYLRAPDATVQAGR